MALTAEQEKKIRLIEKEKKETRRLVEKQRKKKTAEELLEKSKKALGSLKLIEIVQNEPDDRVNLTKVYSDAFKLVFEETGDLKKAKEMAVATRWAAKFKDDYKTEFETEIVELDIKNTLAKIGKNSSQIVPEPKPKPKKVEIELFGDIIFSGDHGMPHASRASLRILRTDLIFNGIKMAADLLESITGIEPLTPKDANFPQVKYGFPYNYHPARDNDELLEEKRLSALRDYLIQILEEKFGVRIRTCMNCRHHSPSLTCSTCGVGWSNWEPEEAPPEKKEEEK